MKQNHYDSSGSNNSQYGIHRIWISHLDYSPKTILKEKLISYLEKGWFLGRQFKEKWVKNPKTFETKKIKLNQLEIYLNNGWIIGRYNARREKL